MQVIIMLVLLMVGEVSVAVIAILTKSLAETDLERDLVARLMEEYNMPGAEVFTRAVDLAQAKVWVKSACVVTYQYSVPVPLLWCCWTSRLLRHCLAERGG